MREYKYLPDIWGALAILGLLLGLEIIISFAFYDMGVVYEYGDPGASVIQVLANGIIFSVLMYLSGMSYKELFHPSTNKVFTTLFVVTVPVLMVIVASFWWLADLLGIVTQFIPEDNADLHMLDVMMSSGVVTIIAICLIAPFLEEMLFRGIILRGFLARYSAPRAILLSSLLFGLIHLNFYQIPGAFLLGCFFGWLFYTTKSLWPGIFAHAINNVGAYMFYIYSTKEEYNLFSVNLLSFMVSLLGVYVLYIIFRTSVKQKM